MGGVGEEAVDDFAGGAIAADGNEAAAAACIGVAGQQGGLPRRGGFRNLDFNVCAAQGIERTFGHAAAAPSAGGGIDDGEKAALHSGSTASRSSFSRICSARTPRLILREAVRG